HMNIESMGDCYLFGGESSAIKVATEDSLKRLGCEAYCQPCDLVPPPHAERRITMTDRDTRRSLSLAMSYKPNRRHCSRPIGSGGVRGSRWGVDRHRIPPLLPPG